IDSTVMPLAKQFSASLGENSRGLGNMLLLVNLLTALVLSILYWLSVQRAIAESIKANSELEVERLRSNVTLAALGDGVLTLDTQQRIRYANPAVSRLLDMPLGRLLGRSVIEVLPFSAEMLQPPGIHRHRDESVHWLTRAEQDSVAVRVSITSLEQDDVHSGSVMVLHDVSQEQNYMRMLAWQQSHDLLTGLDN